MDKPRAKNVEEAIIRAQTVIEEMKAEMELKDAAANDSIEYLTDRKGNPVLNTENICRVLRHHSAFNYILRLDKFKNILEVRSKGKWRPLEDPDIIQFQTQISTKIEHFQRVSKDMVFDAILKVADERACDSAKDYLTSLVWDKTPRLDTWLTRVYGPPTSEYYKQVGSNWLKGLVKRLIDPGCKFDYVLVLEGEQGVRKSTSLAILGGDWHVETTMSTDNKDFFMQFQGKAIVEFSEGETLSRTEVKRLKAIITMQSDKYRPPYGRVSVDFPRRCVFAMTTNQSEYLKDETGNRRWLPVRVERDFADTEWLSANRDQLFAEAYHRAIILKETVYEFPLEETRAMQEERRIRDPNIERISDWYFNQLSQEERDKGITVDQVFKDALNQGFGGRMKTRAEELSIGGVLRRDLELRMRQTMVNQVRTRRWFQDPLKDYTIKVEESIINDAGTF